MKRVAVIGGGLTGLAAAYYLGQAKPDWTIDIYEAHSNLGGKIQTKRMDGFVVELGPDSYLARKSEMTDLICDLGLADQLVANATGQAYVYTEGKIHPIPGGAIMGIPSKMGPFITSSLISWPGKLRAGLDIFKGPVRLDKDGDISIGHFFLHHLGQEMMDKLIEPLLSGIYGGDIYKISIQSTFPHFIQVEQKYGNMVKGMIHSAKAHKKAGVENVTKQTQGVEGDAEPAPPVKQDKPRQAAPKLKGGLFRQLKDGLYAVVEAIEAQMPSNVTIHKSSPVEALVYNKDSDTYHVTVKGQVCVADDVIIATPSASYRTWFEGDKAMEPLYTMDQTSCAIAIMAFEKDSFDANLLGSGLLVTRKTDTPVTACTNLSQKWPQTTPEDKIVLRVFLGKPGNHAVEEHDDEGLKALAVEEIHKLLGFTAKPSWVEINRLVHCMPQYYVGHKVAIDKVRQHIHHTYPRLYTIGTPFDGIGIPDGVKQAKELVEKLKKEA